MKKKQQKTKPKKQNKKQQKKPQKRTPLPKTTGLNWCEKFTKTNLFF